LRNQHLAAPVLTDPADLLKELIAVQAQDYAGAKWALGLRLLNATEESIERAFNEGKILRTHVLRPTWHFVAPEDIGWMLRLTGPRINAAMASYYRKFGLDDAEFARTRKVLTRALREGTPLTRSELRLSLNRAGIAIDGMRSTFILLRAEVDGMICSGPRRGRDFTWTLLENRVPRARMLQREEAVAELSRRYFATRGPATLRDFTWWSGLTMADARAGVAMLGSEVVSDTIDGSTYWMTSSGAPSRRATRTSFLLPVYDEYLIAYTNRSAVIEPGVIGDVTPGSVLSGAPVVLGGRVVGWWKATVANGLVTVRIRAERRFDEQDQAATAAAATRYGTFLGMKVQVG